MHQPTTTTVTITIQQQQQQEAPPRVVDLPPIIPSGRSSRSRRSSLSTASSLGVSDHTTFGSSSGATRTTSSRSKQRSDRCPKPPRSPKRNLLARSESCRGRFDHRPRSPTSTATTLEIKLDPTCVQHGGSTTRISVVCEGKQLEQMKPLRRSRSGRSARSMSMLTRSRSSSGRILEDGSSVSTAATSLSPVRSRSPAPRSLGDRVFEKNVGSIDEDDTASVQSLRRRLLARSESCRGRFNTTVSSTSVYSHSIVVRTTVSSMPEPQQHDGMRKRCRSDDETSAASRTISTPNNSASTILSSSSISSSSSSRRSMLSESVSCCRGRFPQGDELDMMLRKSKSPGVDRHRRRVCRHHSMDQSMSIIADGSECMGAPLSPRRVLGMKPSWDADGLVKELAGQKQV